MSGLQYRVICWKYEAFKNYKKYQMYKKYMQLFNGF